MNALVDMRDYLKDSTYTPFNFFHFKMYIVGNEKLLKTIVFDSYQEKDLVKIINTTVQKGITPVILEAIDYLEKYTKKIFLKPPPCDLSLYTQKEQIVLRELLRVTSGTTISYGALAQQCGFAGAARFVGNVMAKNMFPVVYPCHRVIRSNGSVGNYSGGEDIKKFLLNFEKIAAGKS
ncbi:MAG: MGMT family protein [Spirochaetes bacterium]|nr:MGMT family protein [Spirochaetota bacterium]